MLLLHNSVRRYAWGRLDGLAALVGSEPSGGPEAELWVGAHPTAPSIVAGDPAGRTLAQVIASDPGRWLGAELTAQGAVTLPFLLKVLAVGAPLSLQAHPSAEQAEAGFAREEGAGIALDAPDRTYRDANPKPESLVALTETWALCGFRPPAEAADLVTASGIPGLDPLVAALGRGTREAHRHALAWLLSLEGADRAAVARAAAASSDPAGATDRSEPSWWVAALATRYPGDPSCLAPLLLHLVCLAPGDAVHLPAGNLHAYLDGAGVELMAASDNVLRGGLTPKHVDVDELLTVLSFEPGVPPGPTHKDLGGGLSTYDSGEQAYGLAVIEPGAGPLEIEPTGPSLLLATGGAVDLAGTGGGLSIDGGDAVFVPPGEGPLIVSGPGRLWWATVGDALPT